MNPEKVKKVGLIQGGLGAEREVSLMSSQSVAKAFNELGILYKILEADENIAKNLSNLKPDCVFLAVHGKYAEDGVLQGICEYLKIPYTGSGVLVSALCMDKCFFKDYISQRGIPTPNYQNLNLKDHSLQELILKNLSFLSRDTSSDIIEGSSALPSDKNSKKNPLSFPLVVKPSREGSSLGINVCKNKQEWSLALRKALQYDQKILVESYIEGMELAVSFLNDQVLTPVEIVPGEGFYDYKSKYQSKKTQYILPPRLDKKIIAKCKTLVYQVVNILPIGTYCRVDFIIKDNITPLITEVNTLPGLTTHSLLPKSAQLDGIDFNTLILTILKGACLDYQR
ncbi:MAG: D-alanine--D-alanine ligase [Bdellovibrionales bacterium]|nr:D-alanine--D-alanine ligase [Bdellovibrionales bacterium]